MVEDDEVDFVGYDGQDPIATPCLWGLRGGITWGVWAASTGYYSLVQLSLNPMLSWGSTMSLDQLGRPCGTHLPFTLGRFRCYADKLGE